MYYPKAKVQENQYTPGGQFLDPSMKSYKGSYHITYDGNFYTGATHTTDSQQLTKAGPSSSTPSGSVGVTPSIIANFEYDTITNNSNAFLKSMVIPGSFFPMPTEQDYAIGVITRYFTKREGGTARNIKEISLNGYTSLQKNNLYNTLSLPWKLTGPLHDQVISPVNTIYGVFDTNSRTLSSKELSFSGITQYFPDLIQFARII